MTGQRLKIPTIVLLEWFRSRGCASPEDARVAHVAPAAGAERGPAIDDQAVGPQIGTQFIKSLNRSA